MFEVAQRLGGRVRRQRLEARTKTDAIAEQRALQTDYERGEVHRSHQVSPTLRELTADYIASLERRLHDPDPRLRRSPRTVSDARYKLDRYVLPRIGTVRVGELKPADVLRLLDWLNGYETEQGRRLSPNTRTGILSTLSELIRYAMKRGLVERNVVQAIDRDDRPGTARVNRPRYLSQAQLIGLLERLGPTFRPIAATYAYAGLRAAEALGLRWRDVDLDEGVLQIEHQLGLDGQLRPLKTSASEATTAPIPLLPALERELREHRQRLLTKNLALAAPDALVFTTSTGRPHSQRNVLRAVHQAATAAGLNTDADLVGLHDLRHTLIGLAFEHGLTLPEVSVVARHANSRVTAQVYAGISDDARNRIAIKLRNAGLGA